MNQNRIRIAVGISDYQKIKTEAQRKGISINGLCRYRVFLYSGPIQKVKPPPKSCLVSLTFSQEEIKSIQRKYAGSGISLIDFIRLAIQQTPENEPLDFPKEKMVRSKRITLIGSDEENNAIEKRIFDSGLPMGRFFVRAALDSNLPTVADLLELKKVSAGIGRNLNQIAIAIHQGRVEAPGLNEMVEKVMDLQGDLNEFICRYSK